MSWLKKAENTRNFPKMATFNGKCKFSQKIPQMTPPLNITLGLNPSRIFIQHPKLPLWSSLVILVQKIKPLWT